MGDAARLLAVDDSPTIRKALQLMLEPAGYALEFGATGQEAVDKVKQLQPSILLLDFILPDMRGSDVCRLLAADPETAMVPVILISTKGAEIRQAYQDLDNVVHCITKPFAPEEVTRAVAEVLARSAEERLAKMRPQAAAAAVAESQAPPVAAPADEDLLPPGAPLSGSADRGFVEAWEEGEETLSDEDVEGEAASRMRVGTRHAALELMFETLRTGLEGVYVEEVETRTGAAADEAQSYTDLASRLTRQLAEALDQADSGVPFNLCSDGSVRSLDETLLDTFRRVCRLLFRAAGAGAVESELIGRPRPRLLVISRPESDVFERFMTLRQNRSEWSVFAITGDVRQLPLMIRLYGPSQLIVDAAYGSALWDQLKIIRALPDGQRLPVLAVVAASASGDHGEGGNALAPWSVLGIETLSDPGGELIHILRAWIKRPTDVTLRPAESLKMEAAAANA
jgi:CheY-like chemotaxis protein